MGLDETLRELGKVHKRLAELPSDASSERFELLKRRDSLQEAARSHQVDWDTQRPTKDLRSELKALRAQLESSIGEHVSYVGQAGSEGASARSYGAVQLNLGMDEAQGLGRIRERISRLEGILADREPSD